jgi:hypothetical protein
MRQLDLTYTPGRFVVGSLVSLKATTLNDGLWRVFRETIVRTGLLAQQEA